MHESRQGVLVEVYTFSDLARFVKSPLFDLFLRSNTFEEHMRQVFAFVPWSKLHELGFTAIRWGSKIIRYGHAEALVHGFWIHLRDGETS